MDRLTRKELKTDRLQVETRHFLDYLDEHRPQVIRYGAIAVVLVVVAAGFYLFNRYQKNARHQALEAALRIAQAPVGSSEPGSYPSQPERDKAALKSFSDLAGRYGGSEEAAVALYYVGTLDADQGRSAEAEKALRPVADSRYAAVSSLAKLSLAELWAGQGKLAEAEKLLRELMEKPTLFVSREAATLELARLLALTKPAEARKLLEPLRTEKRAAVSRAALTQLAAVPGN